MVADDDKHYGIAVQQPNGVTITASDPMTLPNRVSLDDDRGLYLTVQLESQASSILTVNTRYNERETYRRLTNDARNTDFSTDTPNLCSGGSVNGVFHRRYEGRGGVAVCRLEVTYDDEPTSVSVTNFAGDRSSYAVAQIRFTEQNWNQPVKVYLRPI